MHKVNLEVSATVKDELYATDVEIEVPSNLGEMISSEGEAKVYNRALESLLNEKRAEARAVLIGTVDPSKAPKKQVATRISINLK